MVKWIQRMAAPVIRLTSVHDIDHEIVFDQFASTLAQALVEEHVRNEPRVVSFRLRALR